VGSAIVRDPGIVEAVTHTFPTFVRSFLMHDASPAAARRVM